MEMRADIHELDLPYGLALVIAIMFGTLAWRRHSWNSIDESLTSTLPQQFDCDNNGIYFDFSPFFDLYQLKRETHQAVFNEIGHVELLEDLISNYFVSHATLNKTVLHLTGRFACLLRESTVPPTVRFSISISTAKAWFFEMRFRSGRKRATLLILGRTSRRGSEMNSKTSASNLSWSATTIGTIGIDSAIRTRPCGPSCRL